MSKNNLHLWILIAILAPVLKLQQNSEQKKEELEKITSQSYSLIAPFTKESYLKSIRRKLDVWSFGRKCNGNK
jgi:hypothetical protein